MKNKTTERRQAILDILNKEKTARVETLSETYGVSEVTIRNDLKFLEGRGLIIRSHGGALLRENVSSDYPLSEKQQLQPIQKRKIAQAAAQLIEDGDSIILDSGTTTYEMLQFLGDKQDVTMLTNAVNIAFSATSLSNVNTLLSGGFLRKQSFSLVGPDAEELLQKYHFDKLFIGIDGMDLNYGISTPNPEEASLNRIMVDISQKVIVVADSSKFNRCSLSKICGIEGISILVTDENIEPDFKQALENMGVEVICT